MEELKSALNLKQFNKAKQLVNGALSVFQPGLSISLFSLGEILG